MKISENATIIIFGFATLLDIQAISQPNIMENVIERTGKNSNININTMNIPKLNPIS